MSRSGLDFSALENRQSLQTVFTNSSERYPEEACGFIFSDGAVHVGTNIQSGLHRSDPARYTRDAHTAFTFSVADMYLLTTSFDSCNPVTIIYHSHPDVGAYFSSEDTDKALFMGQPIHPVMHLVVDVRKGIVKGALLFRWNEYQFVQCQSYYISDVNDNVPTKKEGSNEYV